MPHRREQPQRAHDYTRFCIACGDPHPADAERCPTCGRAVYTGSSPVAVKRCAACASEVPKDAAICPHCFTGVAARREANLGRVLVWLIPLPVVAAVITLALAQGK